MKVPSNSNGGHVRRPRATPRVLDGPFAETKEWAAGSEVRKSPRATARDAERLVQPAPGPST